jgi:hypothetical protein
LVGANVQVRETPDEEDGYDYGWKRTTAVEEEDDEDGYS